MSFPYLAKATIKYKSPHATDLSFAKDETIRVTGPSEDDEDWLVGETLDGSKKGGFPKDFVVQLEEQAEEPPAAQQADSAASPTQATKSPVAETPSSPSATTAPPPMPKNAEAPPSPKLEPKPLASPSVGTPAPVKTAPPAAAAPINPAGGDEPEPAKQSMKDRLAFFAAAQNKASPPPPVKPKPAAGGLTWSQRQKLRQEQEAKEREAGGGDVPTAAVPAAKEIPAAAVEATPAVPATTQDKVDQGTGMSAADAQTSITKGQSLVERMAALQGAGAFGSPAAKPTPPPKPTGKVWSRPPAPEPEPEEESEDGAAAPAIEKVKSPAVEGYDPIAQSQAEDDGAEPTEEGEQTEEEQEKARRAAIAARMAKLGARGPMGFAAPPKPARKPSTDPTPSAQAPQESSSAETPSTETKETALADPEPATSPPTSIPVPAIPRRTAGPRKRGAAPATVGSAAVAREVPAEPENRFERTDEEGNIEPPPQVMVADEEAPLPKTDEQLARERQQAEAAKGSRGAEGARAAGIAVMPADADAEEFDEGTADNKAEPLVGAVGTAGSAARGMGTIADREGDGEIIDGREHETRQIEDDLVEGGDEKDDIMEEAERGDLDYEESRQQPTMVPIHPPADDGDDMEETETPPLPPPRHAGVGLQMGKDEVELKHQHDAKAAQEAEEEEEEEEDEEAPPPPARPIQEHPAGPRSPRTALPPPPIGNSMVPPRDEEDEEEKEEQQEEEEEEEPAPAPPPRRQPSLPGPIQTSVPVPAQAARSPTTSVKSPILPSPTRKISQPAVPTSPTKPPSGTVEAPRVPEGEAGNEEDEEAERRSKIAARMAKLGGFKFGMGPPVPKRSSTNDTPTSPVSETGPRSPIRDTPSDSMQGSMEIPAPTAAPAEAGGEETPEQEAARRRATLARLRAGGALGFGMFNHGPKTAETPEDSRGLEEDSSTALEPSQQELQEDEDRQDAPPPPARPPVPGNRPMPSIPPPTGDDAGEDEQTTPVPPVPLRSNTGAARPLPPAPTATGGEDSPAPPARAPQTPKTEMPASPIRSPSGRRPPIPSVEKRLSQQNIPAESQSFPRQSLDQPLSEEPEANQESFGDIPPPPPPNRPNREVPPIQTTMNQPESPRRSMSTASRSSREAQAQPSQTQGGFSPASRQTSRQQSFDQSRPSMSAGPRPGFKDLQDASRDSGARLARSAKRLFDQGRKGNYSDGSPAGFVLLAMERAGLPYPSQGWGQVVFDQEAASVLKRYDEPRPGDIVALHDAKLKGKKGLQSYSQQVGSVEDPLLAVAVEFDQKKHKIKVLQVERGVPEEVSYRCDDLKSGRIVVYRPGLA